MAIILSGTNGITSPNLISQGNLSVAGSINNSARLSFYTYNNQASHPRYIHLKTDRTPNFETYMYTIRFDGYSYGAALAIATTLVFYNYNTDKSVITVNYYGSSYAGAYKSADGYTVLVLDSVNGYYTGFSLSQFYAAQGLSNLSITATTTTASNVGAY